MIYFQGDDVVLQCVHNGTSKETQVNVGRSVDDHSTVLEEVSIIGQYRATHFGIAFFTMILLFSSS